MFGIKKLLKKREGLAKEVERLRDEANELKQEVDGLKTEVEMKEFEMRTLEEEKRGLERETEKLRKRREEAAKIYQNIADRNMDNLRGLCRFWREEAQAEKARAEEALEVVHEWEEQEAQAELERFNQSKEDEA